MTPSEEVDPEQKNEIEVYRKYLESHALSAVRRQDSWRPQSPPARPAQPRTQIHTAMMSADYQRWRRQRRLTQSRRMRMKCTGNIWNLMISPQTRFLKRLADGRGRPFKAAALLMASENTGVLSLSREEIKSVLDVKVVSSEEPWTDRTGHSQRQPKCR